MVLLFSGRSHSNEVPFFNRGALPEPTRLALPRLCQVKRRASISVSPFLVLYRQPHLLTREAFVSVAPLLTSHKCTSSLCRGPVTSAEHAYLFLHLFFFFFLLKKSQIVFVPQLNQSMNSFQIPPYILLYLNRFVMCIAYFSFLLWFLFRGFLKQFSPH